MTEEPYEKWIPEGYYFNDDLDGGRLVKKESKEMHYRNGREAKNGDKIVMLGGYGDGAKVVALGVLYDATPGNDYCNGQIATLQQQATTACLIDCLHVDDLAELLKKAGLDKRPGDK